MTGIVFDLDGTLVESAPAICDIANTLMDELGLPLLDVAETRGYVGNGAPKFLERALIARNAFNEKEFIPLYARFLKLYDAAPPEANEPMPGSSDALRKMLSDGHTLAICTNKPLVPTRTVLQCFGWDDLFAVVIAGDSLPERKPHPAPLLKAAADLGEPHPFYVGDSEVDAATAEAAKVPFLLYTEGYRRTPVSELGHSEAFNSFAELPALVSELSKTGFS